MSLHIREICKPRKRKTVWNKSIGESVNRTVDRGREPELQSSIRLGESRYLAGDDFTLADLSHLPNTHYLVNGTDVKELFMSRDNVGRWWEEISGRESWKKVVEMQSSSFPKN
uniref:glutathione transferase n=1 Tax=Chenopodium quinoa TaxID=63459 RepID=A0A803NDT2_CHEQI